MGEKVNQFDDIYLDLAPELGLLRLAQSGLGWKARRGEGLFTVRDADLKRTTWLRAARNFQLRIQLRDGRIVKFDGFQRDVCHTLVLFTFFCLLGKGTPEARSHLLF
jgi:structure-specific recognition protein 1